MWLSGLHIPESYLTALVQATCRKNGWPLDRSTLYTAVTEVCLFVCLWICLFVYLSVCLSVCLSVNISIVTTHIAIAICIVDCGPLKSAINAFQICIHNFIVFLRDTILTVLFYSTPVQTRSQRGLHQAVTLVGSIWKEQCGIKKHNASRDLFPRFSSKSYQFWGSSPLKHIDWNFW